MERKECARRRSQHNSRHYPGICLEGLRQITKDLRINLLRSETRTGDVPNASRDPSVGITVVELYFHSPIHLHVMVLD
jgi:hypothetical protein